MNAVLALGIDPGTRNLGWGVVARSRAGLAHVAHGVIRASASLELSARLCLLADELEKILDLHQPTLGSVEQLFFHKDPQAAAKLGHARGMVLVALGRRGIQIVEHAPARVKRTITGNGQASKEQVAQMVRALLKIEDSMPPDASDALAIAITGLRGHESTVERPRSERLRRLSTDRLRRVAAEVMSLGGASKTAEPSRRVVPEHLLELIEKARLPRT